jgi:hypothetical protein
MTNHQQQDREMIITVETSCGETFHEKVTDMTNRQLKGLLEQNADRDDLDDDDKAAIAAMRAELERRRPQNA